MMSKCHFHLSQSESPSNASIPELERQIDKLTKVSLVLHRHTLFDIFMSHCIHYDLLLGPHSVKHFSVKSCYNRLIRCGPCYWARTVTAADT